MNEAPTPQPILHSPSLPQLPEVWLETIGWQPSAAQQSQFQQLYDRILEGNHQLNLTRIVEPEEFWEKHLWDSLRGIKRFLPEGKEGARGQRSEGERAEAEFSETLRVIDIGTGAGFPGVPVAIAQPAWKVTLLDSTRKKIQFLNQLLQNLAVLNGSAWVDRAESAGQHPNHREAYDIALIRAVAAASVCAEYTLPLLKVGGCAVLYRGHWTDQETDLLEPAVQRLGGQIEALEAFKTPLTQGDRHCIYLRKVMPTSQEFPRSVGIPAQKPL